MSWVANAMDYIIHNNENVIIPCQWWEPHQWIVTDKAEYTGCKNGYGYNRIERKNLTPISESNVAD